MRINLNNLGYDVTKPQGDIIALNFSIWDADWIFKNVPALVASARTWFQSPWGNANVFNAARIFARPDVTISTTTLPPVASDAVLPNGINFSEPVINGNLNEPVWNGAYSFNIAYGDTVVRSTYPTIGPLLSGQFQPEIGGNPRPPVIDPVTANIKMFFRDKFLYFGADINDQLIQGRNEFDRMDGVRLIIGDRGTYNEENMMVFRQLRLAFNTAGQPEPTEYLKTLADSGFAWWGVQLKGASTVNNNNDIDEGFRIEMKIDLTRLGYSTTLSDRLLFGGVMVMDGDSFDDSLANYGTRTWWFRENDCCPATAWMVMDPLVNVEMIDNNITPVNFELHGNYPNPFNPSTKIRYSVPNSGKITITFFNFLGEVIYSAEHFAENAGTYEYEFVSRNLSSGVYFYKVNFFNETLKSASTQNGKMILIK
jgi:hypothetical protein